MVVFGVGTDPEPDDDLAIDSGKGPVSEPDACRIDRLGRVDLLEAKARMIGVVLEAAVRLMGAASNMLR